jgi:hypothetical protein
MSNQAVKMILPSQKKWNSPHKWMHLLNGRLLIKNMEENGVNYICTSSGWPDQDFDTVEGRRLLASHRLNYTSQGSQCLEIIWWKWPPENCESLRFGGSMNFMDTPDPYREERKDDEKSAQDCSCFCDSTH